MAFITDNNLNVTQSLYVKLLYFIQAILKIDLYMMIKGQQVPPYDFKPISDLRDQIINRVTLTFISTQAIRYDIYCGQRTNQEQGNERLL